MFSGNNPTLSIKHPDGTLTTMKVIGPITVTYGGQATVCNPVIIAPEFSERSTFVGVSIGAEELGDRCCQELERIGKRWRR